MTLTELRQAVEKAVIDAVLDGVSPDRVKVYIEDMGCGIYNEPERAQLECPGYSSDRIVYVFRLGPLEVKERT